MQPLFAVITEPEDWKYSSAIKIAAFQTSVRLDAVVSKCIEIKR
jgi:hypothetical protein